MQHSEKKKKTHKAKLCWSDSTSYKLDLKEPTDCFLFGLGEVYPAATPDSFMADVFAK